MSFANKEGDRNGSLVFLKITNYSDHLGHNRYMALVKCDCGYKFEIVNRYFKRKTTKCRKCSPKRRNAITVEIESLQAQVKLLTEAATFLYCLVNKGRGEYEKDKFGMMGGVLFDGLEELYEKYPDMLKTLKQVKELRS